VGWAPWRADTTLLQTLMQRNGCTACHLIGRHQYNPKSSMTVAARYAGNARQWPCSPRRSGRSGTGVWGEGDARLASTSSGADALAPNPAELVLALKP
jgi:cytochrome c551/c552